MSISFVAASSQYAQRAAPVTTYPYTLAGYFKLNDATALHALWCLVNSGLTNVGFTVFARGDVSGDPVQFGARVGSFNHAQTTNGYTEDVWQHVIIRATSATSREIILNNDLANKGTNTTSTTPTGIDVMAFGRQSDSTPGEYMDGLLSNWAMWDAILDDTACGLLATGTDPADVEAEDLLALWRFDDEEDLGADSVGSFHLTLFNTPTYSSDEPDLGTDSISIGTPAAFQTYQRDGNDEADIPITGTYTGTPTAIEASFNGGAYATIDASPTAGSFSGTLAGQAAGRGTLTVRFTNDTDVADTVANVGIGDVFAWFGQSNQSGRFTNGQAFTGGVGCSVFDEGGAWANLGSNYKDPDESLFSVLPKLASLIVDVTGVPAAFVCRTTGGTGLVTPDADWTDGGTEFNAAMMNIANSAVNACAAILYYQGERDAANGIDAATYAAALSEMVDDMQADQAALTGVKAIVANMGENTSATNDEVSEIQQGIIAAWIADADILPGPTAHDQDLTDGLHWKTDAEATTLASRWWRCIRHALFSGTEDARGPRFSSATYTDDEIAVTLTGGVSPITNGTDTTGWAVTDGAGVRTVSSASSSGMVITLVCDQALVDPVTVSYADGELAAGTTTRDSGTVSAFPIEPFVDESVTEYVPDPLAAGANAFVSSGPAGIAGEAMNATDGVGPYSYQLQRNEDGGSFSDVIGKTSLSWFDDTATATGVLYGYRMRYTDDEAEVVYSNTVTAQVYEGGSLGGGLLHVCGMNGGMQRA